MATATFSFYPYFRTMVSTYDNASSIQLINFPVDFEINGVVSSKTSNVNGIISISLSDGQRVRYRPTPGIYTSGLEWKLEGGNYGRSNWSAAFTVDTKKNKIVNIEFTGTKQSVPHSPSGGAPTIATLYKIHPIFSANNSTPTDGLRLPVKYTLGNCWRINRDYESTIVNNVQVPPFYALEPVVPIQVTVTAMSSLTYDVGCTIRETYTGIFQSITLKAGSSQNTMIVSLPANTYVNSYELDVFAHRSGGLQGIPISVNTNNSYVYHGTGGWSIKNFSLASIKGVNVYFGSSTIKAYASAPIYNAPYAYTSGTTSVSEASIGDW